MNCSVCHHPFISVRSSDAAFVPLVCSSSLLQTRRVRARRCAKRFVTRGLSSVRVLSRCRNCERQQPAGRIWAKTLGKGLGERTRRRARSQRAFEGRKRNFCTVRTTAQFRHPPPPAAAVAEPRFRRCDDSTATAPLPCLALTLTKPCVKDGERTFLDDVHEEYDENSNGAACSLAQPVARCRVCLSQGIVLCSFDSFDRFCAFSSLPPTSSA